MHTQTLPDSDDPDDDSPAMPVEYNVNDNVLREPQEEFVDRQQNHKPINEISRLALYCNSHTFRGFEHSELANDVTQLYMLSEKSAARLIMFGPKVR